MTFTGRSVLDNNLNERSEITHQYAYFTRMTKVGLTSENISPEKTFSAKDKNRASQNKVNRAVSLGTLPTFNPPNLRIVSMNRRYMIGAEYDTLIRGITSTGAER
jgi:hypothetical protein